MKRRIFHMIACFILLLMTMAAASAEIGPAPAGDPPLLAGQVVPNASLLEELVLKSTPLGSMEGFASYYSSRFTGRRTTSGLRYHPDKLTAAHNFLPLGTVVRVVNQATSQAVHVTITDRCARKPFPFIDLSRAAAQRIGLWGKGKIKVVIIPLMEGRVEEPA